MVSNDQLRTVALVELQGDEEALEERIPAWHAMLTSERLDVQLGGELFVGEELAAQVERDILRAELFTFPILAILLLFVFRSLVAAVLPLGIGAITIFGAFLVLRIVTAVTDISVFAINIVTMLGLGLVIDYSLFVISRFREELPRHQGEVGGALRTTMQTAGRTVVFSGLTVAISCLALLVFPQMFLRSMGIGAAAAVTVAMVTAVTLLPAILALLGHRINAIAIRPLLGSRRKSSDHALVDHGFWYRTSQLVMRRPLIVLILTLIPLLGSGLPFLRATFSMADARSLPESAEGRITSEILASEFPRNEIQPIQVVVHADRSALEPANLDALFDYTRLLETIPGVRRVDSLVNLDPQLDKVAYHSLYSQVSRDQNLQVASAVGRFSKGEYSLVSVLYDSEPQSAEAREIVKRIRAIRPPAALDVQVSGPPAELLDLQTSLVSRIPLALILIVGVIFILLFLMLGSLLVPLKAVLLNIVSLSASFGALVWIFQDGNLEWLFGFTSIGAIDITQPVLIFAIAFGLSMDYEVFLLSRIKEHYERTHDMATSVSQGVQKTARIITSAAILLVLVIGGFATGEILFIKQVGVGLSLAILLDATAVRMLLVPATMRLLGDLNWWAPTPLLRLYHLLGMGEVEQAEPVLVVDTVPSVASAEAG
jgi:RND superfamily putative drug exporter